MNTYVGKHANIVSLYALEVEEALEEMQVEENIAEIKEIIAEVVNSYADFITALCAGILALTGNMYSMDAEITAVTGSVVECVDVETGNLWEFYGDGYVVGEKLTLIMDNCGTLDITDDRIVEVY